VINEEFEDCSDEEIDDTLTFGGALTETKELGVVREESMARVTERICNVTEAMANVTETMTERGSILQTNQIAKMDSDEEDTEIKGEPIVEDLTDISDCLFVTVIPDWDKRFVQAGYTEEQRRIVHHSIERIKEWKQINEMPDWKLQHTENGLLVH